MKYQAKFIYFHSRKCIWKFRLESGSHACCLGLNVLLAKPTPRMIPVWEKFVECIKCSTLCVSITGCSNTRGAFQKHLWAPKFSPGKKSTSFSVWVRYFVWNFKGILWNSTQNILPIDTFEIPYKISHPYIERYDFHPKIWFSSNTEILKALRFKSSYAFLKRRPQGPISI